MTPERNDGYRELLLGEVMATNPYEDALHWKEIAIRVKMMQAAKFIPLLHDVPQL